jgi:exopolysaccharide biosynthesis polyprenyl glycosylphosphotransferase
MLENPVIPQPVPIPAGLPADGATLFRDGGIEELAVAAAIPAGFQPALEAPEPTQPWLQPQSLAQLRVRSYAALLLIDVLSIVSGFLIGNLIRFDEPLAKVGMQYTVDFGAVFLAVAFSSGAYAVEVLEHPRKGLVRILKAMALAACALLLGLFYTKTSAAMSRAVFGIGVVTAATFALSARYAFGLHLGTRSNWKFQNEILLVDGAVVSATGGNVLYAQSAGINPYDNDPSFADRVGELLQGCDHIVLASSPERRAAWLKVLKGVGVDVEVLTPELDQLGALALRNTGAGAAVLVAAGPLGLRDRIVKRTLDLAVAVMLLILLAPLMLLTAAAIKLSSDGPVFFSQRRIGRGNHPFEVLKFRTMRLDACDANGSRSACRDDDRVTTVGAVLRHTSLDELPQLLNVLKGEMSIVGPRPHAVGSTAENDFFWNIDDRYWQRGAVKPGITGLAQIRGFRGATGTRKDLTDRVQADLEYLADWSIWKDIAIILRTIRVVVHPNAF